MKKKFDVRSQLSYSQEGISPIAFLIVLFIWAIGISIFIRAKIIEDKKQKQELEIKENNNNEKNK